jgi:hypothetical protein
MDWPHVPALNSAEQLRAAADLGKALVALLDALIAQPTDDDSAKAFCTGLPGAADGSRIDLAGC